MSAATLPDSDQRADQARDVGLAERVFRIRESGIVAVLVMFVAVTTIVRPRFLDASNIQFVLVDTATFALLALGETMVVISRNVDLSVGSVVGLSAYLSASLFERPPGHPDSRRLPRGPGHRPGLRRRQRDHGRGRAGCRAWW